MTTDQAQIDTTRQVAQLLRGYVVTQLIATAVRCAVPDHLGEQAVTAEELARRTGVEAAQLRRLLLGLEGLGLVAQGRDGDGDGDGRYRATPLTAPLRRGGPLHGLALLAGGEYYQAWAGLEQALRTGESAFEQVHGRSLWTLLDDRSEAATSFARSMRTNTEHFLPDILALHDYPATGVVADIGAGAGTLVAGLLEQHTGLRGIAFEQPAVVEHTRRGIRERGLEGRCELVAGDFLVEVPAGADLYVLQSVVHNWGDDDALRILRNCRRAMGRQARLLVVERALQQVDALSTAVHDLTMLVLFGGRDRTVDGYRALLERAGFDVVRTARGASGICLLEARPAQESVQESASSPR
ncbi:methyltransferase [Pseudonocardia sp.]|uniref:methyltransferase n=1 Tax=Pseudonocardia sp. TaxID=60912 RepID=UPI003D12A5A8